MKRRFLWTAWTVGLLAVLAHAPGLGAGFVYDDHRFVVRNTALDAVDVYGYFSDPATTSAGEGIEHDVYRPLRTLLFAFEKTLFGTRAGWWHAVSLLLHAIGSVLVLRLLWPLVRGRWLAAAFGAALFAVHPVAVESVAWISSQGDLLALDLMLAALLVLERRGGVRTLLGLGLGALACFAKESALVLPALLLLRDLALPPGVAPPRRTTLLRAGLLLAVDAGYMVVRGAVVGDLAQVPEFPGGSRVAAARGFLAGLAWYARTLLWPSGFAFDVHLPVPLGAGDPAAVLGLGLLLTLLLAGAWGLKAGRPLLTFAAWGAIACLVPVSNVLVPLKALVTERFFYPSMIAVAGGVAYALWMTSGVARRVLVGALAVSVVVLVPITWRRTGAWADDLVLWETVLRERPSHMRAYEGLGYEYLTRGRIRDAEIAYRSYLEYNPADGKSMRLLGDAFGEVADGLSYEKPVPGETVTRGGRQFARVQQLKLYARALVTWERVGLERGRGSDAMRRETWEKIIEAAWDLGDLRKAKEANDALLALERVDPTDKDAVFSRGSFDRRRHRLGLAWRALVVPMRRDMTGAAYEGRMKERALVLDDVGIPPRVADDVAMRMLVSLFDDLVAEVRGEAGRGLPQRAEHDVTLSLRAIDLLGRLGRKRDAELRLRDLKARYPDHPILRGDA